MIYPIEFESKQLRNKHSTNTPSQQQRLEVMSDNDRDDGDDDGQVVTDEGNGESETGEGLAHSA